MFDYQPTVLIVEDDPHIRRFVRQALESEGCAVFETETVQRGLVEPARASPTPSCSTWACPTKTA